MKIAARAFAAWLLMMCLEAAHGTLRTLLLAPRLGDFRARQVTVFTGALLVLGVAWLLVRWIGARERRTLLLIGAAWVAMTLAFEVALGRLVLGYDWGRIASDYDLQRGGLLPIGLLAMALAPLAAARLRDGRRSSAGAARTGKAGAPAR